jgi:hypothetical protein
MVIILLPAMAMALISHSIHRLCRRSSVVVTVTRHFELSSRQNRGVRFLFELSSRQIEEFDFYAAAAARQSQSKYHDMTHRIGSMSKCRA